MTDPLLSIRLAGSAQAILRPLLIAMMLGLAVGLVAASETVTTIEMLMPVGLGVAVAAALYFLKSGRVGVASYLLIGAMFGAGVTGIIAYGSIRSVTALALVGAVVVAGVFLGRRALLVTIALTSASVGALIYAEATGVMTSLNRPVGWIHWIVFTVSCTLIGLAVHYAHMVALEALERQQQELAERVQAEATIRRTEERLRLSMEASRQGWFDLDVPTGTVVASAQYAQMIGTDPARQDMTLQSWLHSIHADDREAVLAAFHECLVTGESRQMTYRLRTRTPTPAWLWIRSVGQVVEWDEQRRPLRMTGTHMDVSDTMRASEELRASEEKFRAVVEMVPSGMVIHDDGRITYANAAAARILGADEPAQLVGRTTREIVRADHWARTQERVRQTLTSGRSIPPAETVYVRLDGREVETESIGMPITIAGRPQVLVLFQDITARKRADAALRESEARYRTLFEQAGDKIILLELVPDGPPVIRDANRAALQGLGYTRDELIGAPISMLEPGVTAAQTQERARQARADGALHFETQHRRKDGSVFDAEVRSTEFVMQGRRMALTMERDISARKRDEAALRSETERLSQVLEATSGGTWDWHIPSGTAVFSPRYSGMLGYTPEEFAEAYKEWQLLVHPDDLARVHQAHTEHFEQHRDFSIEYRMRAKSGAWHWIHSRGILIERDAAGNPVRMVGTHTDIHDRKVAEAALHESQARLAIAMEQAHLAHWELDAATRTFTFNDRFYALCGTTAEREGGYRMPSDVYAREFFPADARHAVHDAGARMLSGAVDELRQEHRLRRRDGELRDIVVRMKVVRDAAGRVVGATGVNQDITDLRRAEAGKVALEEQLHQSQKMESVGRLAGGVAHDFNNMLGVIMGVAELGMLQLDAGHPLHADLTEIHDAARRSADLTRQLLTFARKQTVAPTVLNLNDVVARSNRMLERLIGEHITLQWAPGDGLWPIFMDSSQVDQILANLCVNARDAIREAGTLRITTENCAIDGAFAAVHADAAPGDFVRLTVHDTGHGMSPDILAQIFEPFFTTKGVGEGTGLGLATVYGAVRQNRGFITVSSTVGQGTSFEIYLPRYDEAPGVAQVARQELAFERGHETILVVEDEASLLQLTTRALERSGYVVLTAGSPARALELAAAHPGDIDLLLTDVVMPGMNGRSLANAIRAQRPTTEWLFMSGFATDVIGGAGQLDDAARFIGKPFTVAALTAKVREVLDGA